MHSVRLLVRLTAALAAALVGLPLVIASPASPAAAATRPTPTTMGTVTAAMSTTIAQVAADLGTRLRGIKGMSVTEHRAPTGFRFFTMSFTQLVDHDDPSRGTFRQRLTLVHRGLDRPTVLYTSGYNVSEYFERSEPATLLDANQVSLEYRFFPPSIPSRPDWTTQDTIRQAAIDEHDIIVALKAIYREPWLTTGVSKGGMTAVYHRRFFPGDVSGTIAYVSPNDVNDKGDSYNAFLDRVGNQACRSRLTALQRYVLGPGLPWFRARAAQDSRDQRLTYKVVTSNLGHDQAFAVAFSVEDAVVNMPFAFWMYRPPSACSYIPVPGQADNQEIYGWLDNVSSFVSDSDQRLRPYLPYYFQAAYQLGAPEAYETHIRDLLRFPGPDGQPYVDVPRSIRPARFDTRAMPDIDAFVRTRASHMLFLYGSDDPYGAEQFTCGTTASAKARGCYRYVAFGENHSSTEIATLSPAARAASLRLIRSWAGLPPSGAPQPIGPSQHSTRAELRSRTVPAAG